MRRGRPSPHRLRTLQLKARPISRENSFIGLTSMATGSAPSHGKQLRCLRSRRPGPRPMTLTSLARKGSGQRVMTMIGVTGKIGMRRGLPQTTLRRRRLLRVLGHRSRVGRIGNELEQIAGRGHQKEMGVGIITGTGANFFVLAASTRQRADS